MGGIGGSSGNTGRSTSGDESFDPKPNAPDPNKFGEGPNRNPDGTGGAKSGPPTRFSTERGPLSVPYSTNTPAPTPPPPPELPKLDLPVLEKPDKNVNANLERDYASSRKDNRSTGALYGRRGTLLTGLLGLSDSSLSSTKKSLLGV